MQYVITRLDAAGYSIRRKQTIPTSAGQRRPDIIAWKPGQAGWVIDVQVVADAAAGDLHLAHSRKAAYYAKNQDVCDWVRDLTGYAPVFSTITSSWRGFLAAATVNTCAQLGLPKLSLNVLLTRVIEVGGRIYEMHHKTSGGARSHPG